MGGTRIGAARGQGGRYGGTKENSGYRTLSITITAGALAVNDRKYKEIQH